MEPGLIQVPQSIKCSHVRISYPVVVEPRLIQVPQSLKCSHVRISNPVKSFWEVISLSILFEQKTLFLFERKGFGRGRRVLFIFRRN